MPGQTLYEILEVRQTASQNTIRAAWERLSAQWDPVRPYNTDTEARTRYAAIKEAYLTLGNPQRRATYDRGLNSLQPAIENTFSAKTKVGLLLMTALAIGGYIYNGKREPKGIDTTNAIAAAREAEEKAAERARAELARIDQKHERQQRLDEDRARQKREAGLAQHGTKSRIDETKTRIDVERAAKPHGPAKDKLDEPAQVATAQTERDASVVRMHEQRERFEPLSLKMDPEFGAGHQRVSAPPAQNLMKRSSRGG